MPRERGRRARSLYLGNFAGPGFTGQNHLAPAVGAALGLDGIPCTRLEAACASSGAAFRSRWAAVAGGVLDCALVIGVEQMTTQTTARTTDLLAAAGDLATEVSVGATFPALFAMIAARYFHEFGATREHLAAVAVKNHANGLRNPRAHMRKAITMQKALVGRMIAEPLTLYDCSLISDGAAAVLLAPTDSAPDGARVRGIGQASDKLALADKSDITTFPAVRAAAAKAYQMAGLTPIDIDFAEVHDCFTIAELIALEDLGFAPRGCAGPYTLQGKTAFSGERPINASGGLKSKGHPVGATGVAQIVEVVEQIRGECGERQLSRANVGLTQNLGGSGASAVVGIFSR
ncbi:MAG: thiolase domain-containing protein [Bryobacterales bacterium]